MNRLLQGLSFVLLGAVMVSHADSAQEASPEEGYTFIFPSTPESSERNDDSPLGKVTRVNHSVRISDTTFSITESAYHESNASDSEILSFDSSHVLSITRAIIESDSLTETNGMKVRSVKAHLPIKEKTLYWITWAVKDGLVVTISSKGPASRSEDMKSFVRSNRVWEQ